MSLPISRGVLERLNIANPTPEDIRRVFNAALDDIEQRLDGAEKYVELPTTSLRALRLAAQDAEPADKQEGMIALADDTTWDPLGLTLGRPYAVLYSGSAWRRLDA